MKQVIHTSFVLGVFVTLATITATAQAIPKFYQLNNSNYSYHLTGSPLDSKVKATAGYALVGGGEPILEVYRWLIEKSNHGDIVVLRTQDDDIYNKLFWAAGKMDSVETVVVKTRAGAEDPFVLQKIREAKLVFIAGGTQWSYVSLLQGTKLAELLRARFAAGLAVGGTGAGLGILGEYYFSEKMAP